MKQPHDPNRLLGRGKPPSRPVPAYLRPLVDRSVPVQRHSWLAMTLVLIVLLVASVMIGLRLTKPKKLSAKPLVIPFTNLVQSSTALDFALNCGQMRMKTNIVEIDKVLIDSCYDKSGKKLPISRCPKDEALEKFLVKAIITTENCVAERSKNASISYVWELNYNTRKSRLFAGKSGSLTTKQIQPELACVQKSLPEPSWTDESKRDISRYVIAVVALYPAQKRK